MKSNKARSAAMSKLIAVVESEHAGRCDTNTCDIDAAFNAGYYILAANILMGATDCERTADAYAELDPSDAELEAERAAFVASVPHMECGECSSLAYNAEVGHSCGNCGKVLRRFAKNWRYVMGSRKPDDVPDHGMSLRQLAERAEKYLKPYSEATGLGDDVETGMKDLLADFMHLCNREGWSFDGILNSAYERHETENDED